VPLLKRADDDGTRCVGIERCSAGIEPAGQQGAVAVEELHAGHVGPRSEQRGEAFVARPGRREGAGRIEVDDEIAERRSAPGAVVGRTGVHVDRDAGEPAQRLQTGEQALAFVAADDDDSDRASPGLPGVDGARHHAGSCAARR
jgi:hypothetical protein